MRLKTVAWAAAALLLSLDLLFYVLDCTPTRVRLSAPVDGTTLPPALTVEGYAWDRGPRSAHTVTVVAQGPAGGRVEVPAPRDAVRYGGVTAFLLSSFRVTLQLPDPGRWSVRAVMHREDGGEVASAPRRVQVDPTARSRDFRAFTPGHWIPAAMVLAACLTVAALFSRRSPAAATRGFELGFAALLWANEAAYHIYWYLTGGWHVASGLLLQMCGLSILMLVVVFFLPAGTLRERFYELVFFWGLGGALQAILAPDIGSRGFPDYKYFSFFLSHGLIMIGAVYVVAGRGFRPTLRSLLRVFLITNLGVVAAWGLDLLLGVVPPYQRGNYFVMGYPPPSGSVVDLFARLFGPAPRYVVGLELMGLAVFLLLWAPFALAARIRSARIKT